MERLEHLQGRGWNISYRLQVETGEAGALGVVEAEKAAVEGTLGEASLVEVVV